MSEMMILLPFSYNISGLSSIRQSQSWLHLYSPPVRLDHALHHLIIALYTWPMCVWTILQDVRQTFFFNATSTTHSLGGVDGIDLTGNMFVRNLNNHRRAAPLQYTGVVSSTICTTCVISLPENEVFRVAVLCQAMAEMFGTQVQR